MLRSRRSQLQSSWFATCSRLCSSGDAGDCAVGGSPSVVTRPSQLPPCCLSTSWRLYSCGGSRHCDVGASRVLVTQPRGPPHLLGKLPWARLRRRLPELQKGGRHRRSAGDSGFRRLGMGTRGAFRRSAVSAGMVPPDMGPGGGAAHMTDARNLCCWGESLLLSGSAQSTNKLLHTWRAS